MQPDPIKTSDARKAAVPGGEPDANPERRTQAHGEPDAPDRRGQRAAILKTLLDANGEWVSAATLVRASCQYSARVFELRHHDGWRIDNKTEIVGRKKYGFFRIPRWVTVEGGKLISTPPKTTPRDVDRDGAAPLLFTREAMESCVAPRQHKDEG